MTRYSKSKNVIGFGKLLLTTVILLFVISILLILFIPAFRTGPFGIGLPAPMRTFNGKHFPFSITYPRSWVIFETPQGNHGDKEVVAFVGVPGRSFPHVVIASKVFQVNNLEQVAEWEKQRAKSFADYSKIETGDLNTSKYVGQYRKYLLEIKTFFNIAKIECFDYWFLEGNIGLDLTFCADQKDWPRVEIVFDQMIESFSFR